MECELCGKKVDHLKRVKIDGAIMAVCNDCEKFGTPLENYRNNPVSQKVQAPTIQIAKKQIPLPFKVQPRKPKKADNIEELEIVPDFAEVIKISREEMGLSQEDFAAKIKEKRTSIAAIERGSLKPDIKTARKIEGFLKIKLIEKF